MCFTRTLKVVTENSFSIQTNRKKDFNKSVEKHNLKAGLVGRLGLCRGFSIVSQERWLYTITLQNNGHTGLICRNKDAREARAKMLTT